MGLGVELELAIVQRVFVFSPQIPPAAFVTVNISPAAALVAPWSEMLADIDPSRIVLELTEHDAAENYTALGDVLVICRRRGMRLAVDDVGSGFSSFTHVLELGLDYVKIDQSITRNLHLDNARQCLTRAIAEFAEQMDVVVIAEGVETQDELDAMGAAGISVAQGFLLSRPKPIIHRTSTGRHRPAREAALRTRLGTLPHRHGRGRPERHLPAHQPRAEHHARLQPTRAGGDHLSADCASRRHRRRPRTVRRLPQEPDTLLPHGQALHRARRTHRAG